MFTGLIESVCTVRSITPAPGGSGSCLHLVLDDLAEGTQLGDSIAINGVCLTVTRLQGSEAWFDISPETLSKSTLSSLRAGTSVNTERALCVGDRLGGHFVQGHVDGQGKIQTLRQQGHFWDFTFTTLPEFTKQLIPQGSVAIDGISLTVAHLGPQDFSVAVIPETFEQTTLSLKKAGDPVNLEIDMLAKAVRRSCETLLNESSPLTANKLRKFGF